MSDYDIVAAGPADIGPIMDLEVKAFDPELRASRETVLKRFALGHHMLVARLTDPDEGGRLVGQIGFSFIRFSPDDPSAYPTTFKAHSSQPVPPDANTVCLYSLGVDPTARQVVLFRDLLESALVLGPAGGPGCTRWPTASCPRSTETTRSRPVPRSGAWSSGSWRRAPCRPTRSSSTTRPSACTGG